MSAHARHVWFAVLSSGFLLLSCRNAETTLETHTALVVAPAQMEKSGSEQTIAPSDKLDEPKLADGSSTSLRKAPMIQIQPSDLTSSFGTSAIRVGFDNSGYPVGAALLEAAKAGIHLYEWPEMNAVQITTTAHDATGGNYAADGYRRSELAYVEVTPSSVLVDRWYVVRIETLPAGVSRPALSQHETLPDGSIGARFAIGSHPTIQSVRVCDKDSGSTAIMVDFSEHIVADSKIVNRLAIGTADGMSGPSNCALDTGSLNFPMGTTAKTFRFLCQDIAPDVVPLKISVDQTIASPSGGMVEVPGSGRGGLVQLLSKSRLSAWGPGCRIARP